MSGFSRSSPRSGSPSDVRHDSFLSKYQDQQELIGLSKAALKRTFDSSMDRARVAPVPRRQLPFFVPLSLQSLNSRRIHFPPVPSVEPYAGCDPHESPSKKFNRLSENLWAGKTEIPVAEPPGESPDHLPDGDDEMDLQLSDLGNSQQVTDSAEIAQLSPSSERHEEEESIVFDGVQGELHIDEEEEPISFDKLPDQLHIDEEEEPILSEIAHIPTQPGEEEEIPEIAANQNPTRHDLAVHVEEEEEEEEEEEDILVPNIRRANSPPVIPTTFNAIVKFLRIKSRESDDWKRAVLTIGGELDRVSSAESPP